MAQQTNPALNSLIIYELSVMNLTEKHNFDGVIDELDRIRDLGVDVVWLMPIHPRGEKMKFGECGSPYSVRDFRAINPAYGDFDSFGRLVKEVHARGMKVMLDIVYNHTSQDSVLVENHPDYFYQDADGKPMYRFWNDVYDLNYSNEALCDYMVETALMWAKLGVDGYRCDVAPMVPLNFWSRARAEMDKINPDFIWLAETHHYPFLTRMRDRGWNLHSDAEMYQAFDITYDYDVHYFYEDYLKGKGTLKEYVDGLNRQKAMYPMNYIKMRFLENHDQVRVCSLVHTDEQLRMWTAFSYFLKGPALIYAGQEFKVAKRTDMTSRVVFERQEAPWLAELLRALRPIKKMPIETSGAFFLDEPKQDSILTGHYEMGDEQLYGVFNFHLVTGEADLPLPDGEYENLLGGSVTVKNGRIPAPMTPVLVHVTSHNLEQKSFKEHEG